MTSPKPPVKTAPAATSPKSPLSRPADQEEPARGTGTPLITHPQSPSSGQNGAKKG